MENYTIIINTLSTLALACVGCLQLKILVRQQQQSELLLLEEYRKKWKNCKKDFDTLIFIGRECEEFYQTADEKHLKKLKNRLNTLSNEGRNNWIIDSTKNIFILLSDICIKIINKNVCINDIYAIIGVDILRQSKPLRILLDSKYINRNYINTIGVNYFESYTELQVSNHKELRDDIHSFLSYHSGVKRRSLILIDLLWAEAVRIEDLPYSDIYSAADSKITTGKICRKRIRSEIIRIRGYKSFFSSYLFSHFLRHAEYKKFPFLGIGVVKVHGNKDIS